LCYPLVFSFERPPFARSSLECKPSHFEGNTAPMPQIASVIAREASCGISVYTRVPFLLRPYSPFSFPEILFLWILSHIREFPLFIELLFGFRITLVDKSFGLFRFSSFLSISPFCSANAVLESPTRERLHSLYLHFFRAIKGRFPLSVLLIPHLAPPLFAFLPSLAPTGLSSSCRPFLGWR